MDYNYYNYNYAQLPIENQSYTNCADPVLTVTNPILMPNRFVYVNQYFHKPKVLINPNFKKTVHVNPNFKGTILVNPNIMKLHDKKSDCDQSEDNVKSDVIENNLVLKKEVDNAGNGLNERRRSIHTKYKIVHGKNDGNNVTEKKRGVMSKYKIDKRITKSSGEERRLNTRKIIKTRYKLLNVGAGFNKSLKTKRNNKLVSINGVLYKKTPNVLKKADLTVNKSVFKKKLKLLKINGKMYKLNRLPSSVDLMKKKNCILRSVCKKKLLLSQTKNFNKEVFASKMRKCNIPCPIYRRFGKCPGKVRGTCPRIHNPDQIALCTRFLQGACRKKNCLLSHKVSAEKMPTCKYYLEGLCVREDCPYLHVKINPKSEICKDFLEGFCKKAQECDKRHQFLCPDYEKTGICPRKRCRYPHGDAVRKYDLKAKVAKKTIKILKAKIERIKAQRDRQRKDKEQCQSNEKNVRYYIDTIGDSKKLEIVTNNEKENDLLDDDLEEVPMGDSPISLRKRKDIGDLPSFIPLGKNDD